jgi:hypothetical protein
MRSGAAALIGVLTGSLGAGLFRIGEGPTYETVTPWLVIAWTVANLALLALGYLAARLDQRRPS